jgi:hypothetical protein
MSVGGSKENTMEKCNGIAVCEAVAIARGGFSERAEAHGKYHFEYIDAFDSRFNWEADIDNIVTTVGKNAMLDAALAGSSYSAVGPFMGLISSVSWSAVAAGDTMSSHAGWLEAGSGSNYPLLTARLTCNGGWSAASNGAKALATARSFTIGGTGGTVKGCFLVFGTGAVNTIGDTNGTLLSAGVFSGGDQIVNAGGTLNVTYSMSL